VGWSGLFVARMKVRDSRVLVTSTYLLAMVAQALCMQINYAGSLPLHLVISEAMHP